MFKYIFIILLLLSLSHCSINNPNFMRYIEKKDSDISKLNFKYETSFDEFKTNIIKYGEISSFPKLD